MSKPTLDELLGKYKTDKNVYFTGKTEVIYTGRYRKDTYKDERYTRSYKRVISDETS